MLLLELLYRYEKVKRYYNCMCYVKVTGCYNGICYVKVTGYYNGICYVKVAGYYNDICCVKLIENQSGNYRILQWHLLRKGYRILHQVTVHHRMKPFAICN